MCSPTEPLIGPDKFFERFLGSNKLFRHDWKLVGREQELRALHNFSAGTTKVQPLSSKGGDAKTQLLWELCRTLASEAPEVEVLCLNSHRAGDDLSMDCSSRAEGATLAQSPLRRHDGFIRLNRASE
jgi:hypothetical protein